MVKTLDLVYLNIGLLFTFGALIELLNAADPELQCPNNYTSTATITRLKKQVFCKYDRLIRPVRSHNETVDVNVRLILRKFDFDDKTDVLSIQSLFYMWWHDYHLLWNSSEFDGVDLLRVMSYTLWTPDFDIFNSANVYNPIYYFYTICLVYSLGDVVCVPATEFKTICAADLTRWPFDSHTCKIEIGSWTHHGEEVNISLSANPIDTEEYERNREWNLVSTRAFREVTEYECCPNMSYPNVIFEFVIERHSGVYTATVVVPALVLMMTTLITFWMEPGRPERLSLAAIDMFCHFLFMQHIETLLPSNGDKTPLLVTFYRDSLILTVMALFCAILGRNLKSSSQSIPSWASSISSWIFHNRIGQIMVFHNFNLKTDAKIPGTENDGQDTDIIIPMTPTWDTFVVVIDSVFFIVVFFIYIILMLGFIP